MSWTLAFAWCLLAAFLFAQQSEIHRFKGASQVYLFALNVSAILGLLASIALFVYGFFQLAWYWPLALLVTSVLTSAIFVEVGEKIVSRFVLAVIAFIGWPLSAFWVLQLLRIASAT